MKLSGVAKYRYLFWDVYIAALYRGTGELANGEDFPSQELVLHYLRDISSSEFCESTSAAMRKNPDYQESSFRKPLAELCRAFRDCSAGDRYRLVSSDGEITRLFHNDAQVFSTSDKDFAKVFFGIWLSAYGLDRELTERLTANISNRR